MVNGYRGLVAFWIVGYVLRRVVLADVVEPVGTNGHLVTSPGQRVLAREGQDAEPGGAERCARRERPGRHRS